MTGVTLSSADLDPRRRRILFRCWHRGIREMDLVFGQFAEDEMPRSRKPNSTSSRGSWLKRTMIWSAGSLGTLPVPEHLQYAAVRPHRRLFAGFREGDGRTPQESLNDPRLRRQEARGDRRAADDRQRAVGLEPLLLAELARAGQPVAYVLSDGQRMADLEQMLGFRRARNSGPDAAGLGLPALRPRFAERRYVRPPSGGAERPDRASPKSRMRRSCSSLSMRCCRRWRRRT